MIISYIVPLDRLLNVFEVTCSSFQQNKNHGEINESFNTKQRFEIVNLQSLHINVFSMKYPFSS